MDYQSKYKQLPQLYSVNKYKGLAYIEDNRTLKKDILLSQRANDLANVILFARINLHDSIHMIDDKHRQYIYALNSLLWYNSCIDYIWQYVRFDRVTLNVTDINYEKLLKKSYPSSHPKETELSQYTALIELYNKLETLRDFANKLKHKLPIFEVLKQDGITFVDLGSANSNNIIGRDIDWDSKFSSEEAIVHDSVEITTIWDMLFQADKDIHSFYFNNIITSHSNVHANTKNQ